MPAASKTAKCWSFIPTSSGYCRFLTEVSQMRKLHDKKTAQRLHAAWIPIPSGASNESVSYLRRTCLRRAQLHRAVLGPIEFRSAGRLGNGSVLARQRIAARIAAIRGFGQGSKLGRRLSRSKPQVEHLYARRIEALREPLGRREGAMRQGRGDQDRGAGGTRSVQTGQ